MYIFRNFLIYFAGHIMMSLRDMLYHIKDKLYLAFVDKIQLMKVDKIKTNYTYATHPCECYCHFNKTTWIYLTFSVLQ